MAIKSTKKELVYDDEDLESQAQSDGSEGAQPGEKEDVKERAKRLRDSKPKVEEDEDEDEDVPEDEDEDDAEDDADEDDSGDEDDVGDIEPDEEEDDRPNRRVDPELAAALKREVETIDDTIKDIEEQAQELLDRRTTVKARFDQVQADIKEQTRLKREAIELGTVEGFALAAKHERFIDRLNEKVADHEREWAEINAKGARCLEKVTKLEERKKTIAARSVAKPKAMQDFLERNKWFDPDPKTTDKRSKWAHEQSGELLKDYKADSPRLYKTLEARLARRFPKTFGKKGASSSRGVSAGLNGGSGASSSSSAGTKASGSVKTTKAEKAIMRQVGIKLGDRQAVERWVNTYRDAENKKKRN